MPVNAATVAGVQVVAPGIGDTSVDLLDAGLCLPPVIAELDLATQGLLRLAQGDLVTL